MGAYIFEERGRGAYFIFLKSWLDVVIFNTSSACKKQHKLFIDMKSLNRDTVSICNFFSKLNVFTN